MLDRGITVRTCHILRRTIHRCTLGCKLCELQRVDSGTTVRIWLRPVLALQWVQTKEEWDREKVYLAELGYVPDEADPEVSLLFLLVVASVSVFFLHTVCVTLI